MYIYTYEFNWCYKTNSKVKIQLHSKKQIDCRTIQHLSTNPYIIGKTQNITLPTESAVKVSISGNTSARDEIFGIFL